MMLALVFATSFILPNTATAAGLTAISDTMSRQAASQLSVHKIAFTSTSAIGVGGTIAITFPSGFTTTGLVITDLQICHGATTGLENGTAVVTGGTACTSTSETIAASPSTATVWGAVISGTTTVTFTAPSTSFTNTIAAGHKVIVTIAAAHMQNPTASTPNITITTTSDSGSVTVPIIADEQVVITATVTPTISFAISDVTIGFGALSTSTGRWATGTTGGDASATTPTAAHTLATATNGTGGYTISYNGATLTSGSDTISAMGGTVNDSDGDVGNTEQFGISASTDGTATIESGYERDSTASWKFVAGAATTLVTQAGPTATETVSVSYLANITATTEAGAYTTTLTYIATGNF